MVGSVMCCLLPLLMVASGCDVADYYCLWVGRFLTPCNEMNM